MSETLNDKPISNIFLVSLSALTKQLKTLVFPDRELKCVIVQSENHLRALFKQQKKIKYPFFVIILGQIEKRTNGYNPSILMRRGIVIAKRQEADSRSNFIAHLLPININMTIRFVTNTIDDVYAFVQKWQILSTRQILNFKLNIEEADSSIEIKLNLEENIAFPNLEMEDIGETLITETSVVMQTYTGVLNRRVIIEKTNLDLGVANSQGHTVDSQINIVSPSPENSDGRTERR